MTMGMSFAAELSILVRARYPIIYVVTAEEQRAQQIINGIGQERQKKVFEWSATLGVVPAGTSIQLPKLRNAATRDPGVALEQVIEQVEPAIFVFKDFHPYLTKGNHDVIRKLKEIALYLRNSFKTIILVSPVLEIPVELEKEITVLLLPLPSRLELNALLEAVVEDVRRYKQVRIELEASAREKLLRAAQGLTLIEAENVLARIIVERERLTGQDTAQVLAEKQQIVRKSGLLDYHETDESFASIGGLAKLKEWLTKRGRAFSEEARAFGLSAPRGVLLLGVQGCGKSLCAKAISSAWQLPLLRFDIGRMFGSFIGSSEENMRRAIAVAESIAPAVLWVDEIDKAFAGARQGGAGDNGTSARVFGTFLTWLSEKTAPVFVVATANDISQLPSELLRKGRLDEIFFVDLPNLAEREEILAIHLTRRGRDAGAFPLTELASASEDFSGAEIEEAVNSALFDAFNSGGELNPSQLLEGIAQTIPLARTMREPLAELRAWVDGRARRAS